MSVGRIALGVFLGNLAFGVLAWAFFYVAGDRAQAKADRAASEAQYRSLEPQSKGANGSTPSP